MKSKQKKNGKFDNVQIQDNKKHGVAIGKELSNSRISISNEVKKKSSISKKELNSRMIEELLMEKVELIYKVALEKLRDLGYRMDVATRAILINGSIFGGRNILSNVLANALDTMNKGQVTEDNIQTIFSDVHELARFSMQTLINMIVRDQPHTTKIEAILYLLQSDSLAVYDSYGDPNPSKDHNKDLGNYEKGTSVIDIGKMLKENTATLKTLKIIPSSSSSTSKTLVADLIPDQSKVTCPYSKRSEESASSDASESGTLELFKSFTNCPDGLSFQDWMRTCGEDKKDEICSSMTEEIKKLEAQVMERREWAEKTVIEAAKKFNSVGMELKDLRLERKEKHGLNKHKEKEALENANSKISEGESHLRIVNHDLEILNKVKSILDAKNQECKSEIAAYNLSISESEKFQLEAQKNERKALKKSKDTEKNIESLNRSIEEEKQKMAEMAHRMKQVNEAIGQAKLRLRQEKEAKEQARTLLMEEKRLLKLEKENFKNRLVYVRRELDIKYHKLIDEENRMELELSQLKAQDSLNVSSSSSYSSSSSSSSSAAAAAVIAALEAQNHQHQSCRKCMICRKGGVSVLFLPCAHQVICSDCNEEVYDALEDHCPCCKIPIEKRVKVYGSNA